MTDLKLLCSKFEQLRHLLLTPPEVLYRESIYGHLGDDGHDDGEEVRAAHLLHPEPPAPLQGLGQLVEAAPVALDGGGALVPGEPPVPVHDEGHVPRQGAGPQHGYGQPLGGARVDNCRLDSCKAKSQTP